jgi:hypothetical protein
MKCECRFEMWNCGSYQLQEPSSAPEKMKRYIDEGRKVN